MHGILVRGCLSRKPAVTQAESLLLTPGAVEVAFRVQAFEAVGAEEIALGLDEIGGSAGLAVAVEIGQRRGKGRKRQAFLGATGHDVAEFSENTFAAQISFSKLIIFVENYS